MPTSPGPSPTASSPAWGRWCSRALWRGAAPTWGITRRSRCWWAAGRERYARLHGLLSRTWCGSRACWDRSWISLLLGGFGSGTWLLRRICRRLGGRNGRSRGSLGGRWRRGRRHCDGWRLFPWVPMLDKRWEFGCAYRPQRGRIYQANLLMLC